MVARIGTNVIGPSPDAKKILIRDRDGVEDYSYEIQLGKAIHPAITPGPKLDAMSRLSVQKVFEVVETLALQAPKTLRLFEWVRKEITFTTTEAVYGPKNPFRDVKLQEDYW